jgi:integrase
VGGAGQWHDDYARDLKAAGVARVVVCPDNDDPGRRHADTVARSCHAAGLTVRVLELPDLPPTGDVSDYLATHSKDDLRAASTLNHLVQTLKAVFRWAARKGYIPRSPISDESALKRSKMAQRRRRVLPAEEQALSVSRVLLQWLIIAAVDSGARLGELLAPQWADVDTDQRTMLIRAVEDGANKTDRSRAVPISTRLAAVFEMARHDPADRPYPPLAYVFGNLGEPQGSIKKAWETAVLKAHGHRPAWTRGALAPASRAVLKRHRSALPRSSA